MTGHTPPTDQQLDEYEALADAATAGPWHLTDSDAIVAPLTGVKVADVWEPTGASRNGEFIEAMSPEVAKALVAEVRRLRAELEASNATALTEAADKLDRIGHAAAAWILRDDASRPAAVSAAGVTGEGTA